MHCGGTLETNDGQPLASKDVQNALEEMLFSGGTLNVKLLGGRRRIGFESPSASV
jgi:hypothetical protein